MARARVLVGVLLVLGLLSVQKANAQEAETYSVRHRKYGPQPRYGYEHPSNAPYHDGHDGHGQPSFPTHPESGGYPTFDTFDNDDCISTVQEFAEAFNTGGVRRCVSDNILVRIEQYFDPLINTTKNKMFLNWAGGRRKSSTLWSYGDNPEKYIRIGRAALTLGNYVNNPPVPPDAGLQSATFPGIRDPKNFAALLEAIGYSSSDSNAKLAYMLVVTERPKQDCGVPTFVPTWGNLLKYFEWYVHLAASTPEALNKAQISDNEPFLAFKFDRQTRDILTSTTFADLTNCSAKCTVQDTNFGTVPDPLAGTDLEWTSPTRGAPRLNDNTCDLSGPPFNSSSTRWELTEPTILDERAQSCSATYKMLLSTFRNNCQDITRQNVVENRALALKMAQLYMDARDDTTKALVIRTYLLVGCTGTYNALFSGDGFTYTGNGGFLGATGTEFDTGEVLPPEMPKVYPRVRIVFFCPVAQDGTPYDHAICPESIVGQFDLATAVQSLQPGIDVEDWDVQEVKPE